MTDFNAVARAVLFLTDIDIKNIDDLAKEYGEYSNQDFPQELIRKFKLTGLSNIDFLTSDFLHQYGFESLISFEVTKNS